MVESLRVHESSWDVEFGERQPEAEAIIFGRVHKSPWEVEFGEIQTEDEAILSLLESIGVHESPWEVEFGEREIEAEVLVHRRWSLERNSQKLRL